MWRSIFIPWITYTHTRSTITFNALRDKLLKLETVLLTLLHSKYRNHGMRFALGRIPSSTSNFQDLIYLLEVWCSSFFTYENKLLLIEMAYLDDEFH